MMWVGGLKNDGKNAYVIKIWPLTREFPTPLKERTAHERATDPVPKSREFVPNFKRRGPNMK